MATYTKYNVFTEHLASGIHDFSAVGHTLKVALTNSAPNVSTHQTLSDITEISAGNGYTAGGEDVLNDQFRTGGVLSVSGTDVTWTASVGSIAQFRYVVLYNDTPTTPVDPLIAYWDYGSAVDLAVGESFTVDFNASAIFTIT